MIAISLSGTVKVPKQPGQSGQPRPASVNLTKAPKTTTHNAKSVLDKIKRLNQIKCRAS
jgi:hypothetical protein